jgi:hypothetical protein
MHTNKSSKRVPKGTSKKSGPRPQEKKKNPQKRGQSPKVSQHSSFQSPKYHFAPTPPPVVRNAILRKSPLFGNVTEEANVAVGSLGTRRHMSLSGNMFSGINMHVRQPLVTLSDSTNSGAASSAQPGFSCVSRSGADVSLGTAHFNMMTLSPLMGYGIRNGSTTSTPDLHQEMVGWDSPVSNLISACFGEYKVKSLTVHFEPNAVTGQQRTYCFAYSMDPLNTVVGIQGYYSRLDDQVLGPLARTVIPDAPRLDACTAFITFQPWMSWSMDLPVDDSWKFMTAIPVYDPLVLGNAAYNSAIVRDTQFGAFSLISISGNGSSSTYGRLWIDATFEFRDPSPISNSYILPLTDDLKTKSLERKEEEKQHDPDNEDIVWAVRQPPSVPPTPSGHSSTSVDSSERKKVLSRK